MTARLALALATLLALIGVAAWLYHKGGEAVVISIERQNNASGDISDQARDAYDRCVPPHGSGVYDFATGKCKRPSARGRN